MPIKHKSKVPCIACNHMDYPLVCDNDQYASAIKQIEDIFKNWVHMELTYLSKPDSIDVSHPVIALARLPVRSMPYNDMEGLFNLKIMLNSTEFSGTNVANRFLDTIQLIQVTIPLEIQLAITGKFLYAMTQGVIVDSDGQMVGDLEDWSYILREYPWISLMPIYHSVMFTDQMSRKLGTYLMAGIPVNISATE